MLVGPSFYMSIRKKKKNEVNRLEHDEASLYMHFNILTSFDLDTFFLERILDVSSGSWASVQGPGLRRSEGNPMDLPDP